MLIIDCKKDHSSSQDIAYWSVDYTSEAHRLVFGTFLLLFLTWCEHTAYIRGQSSNAIFKSDVISCDSAQTPLQVLKSHDHSGITES